VSMYYGVMLTMERGGTSRRQSASVEVVPIHSIALIATC
jgi:hypothetical protein